MGYDIDATHERFRKKERKKIWVRQKRESESIYKFGATLR